MRRSSGGVFTLRIPSVVVPIALILGISLLGCATARRFDVQISSLAHPDQKPPAAYVLIPADPAVSPPALQFLEFARAVEVALATRGFERQDPADPQVLSNPEVIAIAMDYGIGQRETRTITYPTPAFAYYPSYYPSHYPSHYPIHYGSFQSRVHRRHYRNRGFRRGRYPYGHFYPAYSGLPSSRTIVTYRRFLSLEARTIAPGSREDLRAGTPLWATEVESRGSLTDLRRVFPVLVGAAIEYLATDTGERIETRISEDDERIVALRRGIHPALVEEQDRPHGAAGDRAPEPAAVTDDPDNVPPAVSAGPDA